MYNIILGKDLGDDHSNPDNNALVENIERFFIESSKIPDSEYYILKNGYITTKFLVHNILYHSDKLSKDDFSKIRKLIAWYMKHDMVNVMDNYLYDIKKS